MFSKLHPTAGARPGTLVIAPDAQPTRIRIIEFDVEGVTDRWLDDEEAFDPSTVADGKTVWIHLEGFQDVDRILCIAEHFNIHPLAMEDVINVPKRPKQEPAERYMLAIARSVHCHEPDDWRSQQVAIILGANFVISFQESSDPIIDPVVNRLRRPGSRLRSFGTNYLGYALLDVVIDGYFPVLEQLGEQLEQLEAQVLTSPHPSHLQRITHLKRRLINLRRITWAQRDMVAELLREESSLASEQVHTYTRNAFEHCVQIAEVVDMYRETATGLVNTYLSSVGQRTNEIMKTLTIVGSIFIPLTFLAGIYGMNFEYMPELQSRWAYPVIWGIMAAVAVGMFIYFYRLGWIGQPSFSDQIGAAMSTRDESIQTEEWSVSNSCEASLQSHSSQRQGSVIMSLPDRNNHAARQAS